MHVAEAGTGEPLVLLHGFPQHWWAWRAVLPALAEHHRVAAPDLRGAGWTDAPAHGYTEAQLVADVVGLLDALGLDRVCLAGLDLGGILGYRVCPARREQVRRFVSMAAPHPYPVLSAGVAARLWRLWPSFLTALPVVGPGVPRRGRQRIPRRMMTGDTTDPGVWSADDLELYLGRLREPSRARAAAALYRALAMGSARRAAADAYRTTRLVTPTLALYGTVLYAGDRDAAGHPGILHGYEPYADDVTLAHVRRQGAARKSGTWRDDDLRLLLGQVVAGPGPCRRGGCAGPVGVGRPGGAPGPAENRYTEARTRSTCSPITGAVGSGRVRRSCARTRQWMGYALGALTVSPDGRLLAYFVDTTGGERFSPRVRDLETGHRLPDTIEDTAYGVAWAGSDHLVYTRADAAWRPYVVLRHRLGTAPAGDAEVLREPDERFWVDVDRSPTTAGW